MKVGSLELLGGSAIAMRSERCALYLWYPSSFEMPISATSVGAESSAWAVKPTPAAEPSSLPEPCVTYDQY